MLQQRLKRIKSKLKAWNKKEFGNILKARIETKQKLQEINQINITKGFNEERQKLTNSLQEEWEDQRLQEEIFWRQKSRIQWIKEGERNTKFFHKSTMAHRAHNRITKIKDSQGIELVSHKDMESSLVQHFFNIAKEPMEDKSRFIDQFTQYIPKLVTREDNHNLNKPVSEEEISEVIKEMQSGKALGPDGFNVDFFKTCWETVKQDILEVVEDSRKSKKVLKALNASFIALITKKENVMTLDGFQPIALCNVVYKIISKVIANRLKPLLPSLISKEQTGYVEGRQILNNIIQAHEVVHSLKCNNQAVTTTSFSILLNGAPSSTFIPSRGLRQGDLLSLFLFVLMMEGLGRAIKMANVEGQIQGIKLTPNGEANTHQQFADDTMLQGIPTVMEARAIKTILNNFAMAAGTEVSLNKSKVFFFNSNIAIQRNITRILGFPREQLPSKYLGIPLTDKPLSKKIWEQILNKLQDKIRKWTCRSLNLAGRLVLT
eukprot:PITA_12913